MWKYGLIKIKYDGLWDAIDGNDYCELVELYCDARGNYTSFCNSNIHSLKELNDAYTDIHRDGINTWFSENGIFTWNSEDKFWDWTKVDLVG